MAFFRSCFQSCIQYCDQKTDYENANRVNRNNKNNRINDNQENESLLYTLKSPSPKTDVMKPSSIEKSFVPASEIMADINDDDYSNLEKDDEKRETEETNFLWHRKNEDYQKVLTGDNKNGLLKHSVSPRTKTVRVKASEEDCHNSKIGIEKSHVKYSIKGIGTIKTINGDSVYSSKMIVFPTEKNKSFKESYHKIKKHMMCNNNMDDKHFLVKKIKDPSFKKTGKIKSQKACQKKIETFKKKMIIGNDKEKKMVTLKIIQQREGIAKFIINFSKETFIFKIGAVGPKTYPFAIQLNDTNDFVPFYAVQILSHFGFKNLATIFDPASQVSATKLADSPHLNQTPIIIKIDANKTFTFTPIVNEYTPIYPPLMRSQIEDAFNLIKQTKTGRKLLSKLVDMGIKGIEHRFSDKGATVNWNQDYLGDNSEKEVKYFMEGDPTRSHHYEAVDVQDIDKLKFCKVTAPMARVIFHELVHAYHTGNKKLGRQKVDQQVKASHYTFGGNTGTWSNIEEVHTITGLKKDGSLDDINENAFLAEIGVRKPRAAHSSNDAQAQIDASKMKNKTYRETIAFEKKDAETENEFKKRQEAFYDTYKNYPNKVNDIPDQTKIVKKYEGSAKL